MYDQKNIRVQSKRHSADSSVNRSGFVAGLAGPARNPVNTQ